jgi:membrane protein
MAQRTREREQDVRRGDGQPPDRPADPKAGSWFATLKRTFREFKEDNLTDWAAALTYYGILSIFPALLALVSVLGLVGDSATQPLIDNVGKLAPGPAKDIATSAIQNLQKSQGAAGITFIVGLALALWSASGYVAAFMRACNAIYDVEEGRPIWKTVPTRVLTTLVLLIMLAAVAIAVALTGGLAKQLGKVVGVGSTAVEVWDIAKWPVILLAVITMFAFLYWATPNVRHPKFRWISPGGVVGVVVWILASAGFAFYVANFASYDKTYGSLGGAVVLLVWLWITNLALLLGVELNAERERSRELEEGVPGAERELQLDARDEPKRKRTT